MPETVDKIQKLAVDALYQRVKEVLGEHKMLISDDVSSEIQVSFADGLNRAFDKLKGEVPEAEKSIDFENLSLVPVEDLNALVAVEGMVAAARNRHLAIYISFNARLNSLLPHANLDESNNPLDPQALATAFSDALKAKADLKDERTLTVYRTFNEKVLKQVDKILNQANQLLIEEGVLPDLGSSTVVEANPYKSRRSQRFTAGDLGFESVESVEQSPQPVENPELFSMMQNLMHTEEPTAGPAGEQGVGPATESEPGQQQYAVPTSVLESNSGSGGVMQPFQPAPGEKVEMVDQAQLITLLTNIQNSLDQRNDQQAAIPTNLDDIDKVDIGGSLGEMLKDNEEQGVVNAVDRQSSDIINLVTLLYDAIFQDFSVPIPIKELIGRTQITIIKVALSDTTFFDREDHPARMLLNEFAEAGIGWTEVDNLDEDPMYRKIEDLVVNIQQTYDGDNDSFFQDMIREFRKFKARQVTKTRKLEQRIQKSKERENRLDDITELVTQKINERLLGETPHPFVTELLEVHFHKFMELLLVKEGPGSAAWKQSINTIDVLLWTVQAHNQTGDRERLDSVNPRLLSNLRKALRIARTPVSDIDSLISRLQEVQNDTFDPESQTEILEVEVEVSPEPEEHDASEEALDENQIEFTPANESESDQSKEEAISEDDPILDRIDAITVGTWVEFTGYEESQSVRCKLAAKIRAIDKFIFVNLRGIKVVEKTRMGLASELKDETLKIVSDGLLFSRAMESVIGDLRDSQHEQQTGGAYQPETSGENAGQED